MPVTAVNVLNNNSFPLEDRYSGVLYTFTPGRALTIPVEAAKHILGWDERYPGDISFRHVESRWGWNTKQTAPFAWEWARNVIVRPVSTKLVEIIDMPTPEHRPRTISPKRNRELTRLRVARFRARQKVLRAAAEGRCNAG